MRTAPLLLAVLLGSASAACETVRAVTCDKSPEANPEVVYNGGLTADNVYSSSQPGPSTPGYMSSPWEGELLFFPGGMHYGLRHGLNCTPQWVDAYLSFDQYGTRDGGSLAQAAGNQVVILGMDCQSIHVANDSCVDYWLLLTAGVDPASCMRCM
jgi:hypothetical protein